MPLISWSKHLFSDRIDFEGALSWEEVQFLLADPALKTIQFSTPVDQITWELLNDEFFPARPEVELRAYGFYGSECDLSFTGMINNVRHFSADCLMDAVGLEQLAGMGKLESLGVGVYHLESFDFLNQVTPGIKKLFLGRTQSARPTLANLSRFSALEEIYLEGHHKEIEVLSQLVHLRRVILRSITTTDLGYLRPLQNLAFLEIKLGGIRNLDAIAGMEKIKYLEIWRVRQLTDTQVVSSLAGLQFLALQSLPHILALPALDHLVRLRRISLAGLKGLREISSVQDTSVLEDYIHWGVENLEPEDFIPLLQKPGLKRVAVSFGSAARNRRFMQLLEAHGMETNPAWGEFVFL